MLWVLLRFMQRKVSIIYYIKSQLSVFSIKILHIKPLNFSVYHKALLLNLLANIDSSNATLFSPEKSFPLSLGTILQQVPTLQTTSHKRTIQMFILICVLHRIFEIERSSLRVHKTWNERRLVTSSTSVEKKL